jgi:hypothetical protein
LVGGAVAWAFKILDGRREDRRRSDEYLAGVAEQLWGAYLGVKVVRRALRAAGFGPLAIQEAAESPLTKEGIKDFREQMELLSDAQTTLEKLKVGVKTQPPVYYPVYEQLLAKVTAAEEYVSEVMDVWEKHSKDIVVGATLSQIDGYGNLSRFLDHARVERGLKQRMSYPVGDAALLIQSLRFERPWEMRKTAKRVSAETARRLPG